MRRAIPVIAATAGGLALLAGFHSTPEGPSTAVAAGGSPPRASDGPQSTTTTARARVGSTPAPTTTTAKGATQTVDGPVVSTRYGDVQVRISLSGSRITDVTALKLPSDRSRSQRISQEAGPILRSEALQAQSANIDIVSGASFTSEGYAESLQGALDQAHR